MIVLHQEAPAFHPAHIGAKMGNDGQHYLPDPSRAGKYMKVLHEGAAA